MSKRRGRKWSSGVYVEKGALGGWHDNQAKKTRHTELRRVARRDGAAEVSRRLNFVSNVSRRMSTAGRVAREDQRWVAANLENDDRMDRRQSKPVRVRGSRRAGRHRRRRPSRSWASRQGRRLGRALGPRRRVEG
jgi:hypothetical protein